VLLGKVSCYNAMTLAATRCGVTALAAHQAMICIFFLGCKFGDAVSQTAQAYLPACFDFSSGSGEDDDGASAGGVAATAAAPPQEAAETAEGAALAALPPPPARAQRLSARLLRLSTFLGSFVSVLAFCFATRFSTL
jgi:hypothetical protein